MNSTHLRIAVLLALLLAPRRPPREDGLAAGAQGRNQRLFLDRIHALRGNFPPDTEQHPLWHKTVLSAHCDLP